MRLKPLASCLVIALVGVTPAALAGLGQTIDHRDYARGPVAWRSSSAPTLRTDAGQHPNDVLPVTSCADDGGPGTLRSVVASAASGDTVDLSGLACATITLQSGEIDIHVNDLTIQGSGADELTIDGAGAGRVFRDYATASGVLNIADVTIANGSNLGFQGGCIFAAADVNLTRSRVSGCHLGGSGVSGAFGGGIDLYGDLTVEASVISGNTATSSDTVFGGGIYCGGDLTVIDSTISDNLAFADGGGDTHAYGGGAALFFGSATISGSTFSGNNATNLGGGVFNSGGPSSTVTIINSTISGNTAGAGGGIRTKQPLLLQSSTVAFNSSYTGGGGVLTNANAVELQSSIVADNEATASAPVYAADLGSYFLGFTVSGENNLVTSSDLALPPDTLSGDPALQPLADNGGPTLTHALADGSPAIDAGNNAASLEFDQRGAGFPRVSGGTADIGAFELQGPGLIAPTLDKTFAPAAIFTGDSSTLTITLDNANAIVATLQASLIDVLPNSVVVAMPANVATTCPDGMVSTTQDTVVLDSGAQIPASGQCTVTVTITSNVAGDYTNLIPAGALQTDVGQNEIASSAELRVEESTVQDRIFADGFDGNTPLG